MLTVMMLVGMNAYAQKGDVNESRSMSISTTEDGKVKLKVITKNGDDTETFEKTYDSREDMENDPELKERGITLDGQSFGGSSFQFGFAPGGSQLFQKMPRFSMFFDDEDGGPFSSTFSFDIDSLMSNMHSFRSGSPLSIQFGSGGGMDIDSLMQKFDFHKDGGKFFLNGEEFMDMESLRKKLREQFDDMDFDFDFDFDDTDGSWSYSHGNGDDDFDVHVVSRARVFIRAARDADKEAVGADQMEDLKIRDVSFYPNPSDGRFNVEIDTGNGQPVQVKIIDPAGSVVYDRNDQKSSGKYNFKVDISGSEAGIYILQIIQNNSALTKRIIIE